MTQLVGRPRTLGQNQGDWGKLGLVKTRNLLYYIQNVQNVCLVLQVQTVFQLLNQLLTVHITMIISGPLEVTFVDLAIQKPKSRGEELSMRTLRWGSYTPTGSWNSVTVFQDFSESLVAFCLYALLFLISESLCQSVCKRLD